MSAGRLSEKLIIKTTTPASDGQGGASETPSVVATIAAEPIPLSASEQLQAETVGSHAIYRFRARVRSGVTPGMTALWTPRWPAGMSAKVLQITGVQPLPDRQFMQLSCAEVH
jgi:head-tail adaptor